MRRLLAALSLFALLTACGGDGSTGPAAGAISGTYTLRTINGSPMPYVAQQGGGFKYEITDDAYTFTEGGAWTELGHDRTTSNGVETIATFTDAGSYTRNGAGITLVSPATGAATGSESNGTLTLNVDGFVFVYMK